MVVKKKSTQKKERDQKRWTMFMARHETAIKFSFFNVSDAELISFLKVSRPTVPDQKKRTTVGKKILALRELNNKQQRNIEIFEQKLSMSWKKNKENMARKQTQVLTLEEKLEDARTKNKALEKKISRKDVDIFKLESEI